MKTIVLIALSSFALYLTSSAAEHSTEVKNVHMCCKGCSGAVEKAVSKVPGATAKADPDSGTVTLTAPDAATVQKAADAMVAGGFFGKCSDPDIKLRAQTGAKAKKVKSLKVEGVHLCCGQCVESVQKAADSVSGVKGHTAVKGAKSFEVTGNFNDAEFFEALQKQGMSGTVAK